MHITFLDFVLWQPVTADRAPVPRFSLILSTPGTQTYQLNVKTKLMLEGLPQDAESVELLIHTTSHTAQKVSGRWFTDQEITLTPELTARQRRVRIRFSLGGRTHTQEPYLAFRVLGAAILRYRQVGENEIISLVPLPRGTEFNRSEETAYLRIWTPEQRQGESLYEGDFQIGRLRNAKIRLCDIPGNGGTLRVASGEEMLSLDIRCQDRGSIRDFLPPIMHNPAQLSFSQEKEPQEFEDLGYSLWEWFAGEHSKAKLFQIQGPLLNGSTKRKWKFQIQGPLLNTKIKSRKASRCIISPFAIALAWKGSWIGAWWRLEGIRDYLESRSVLSEQDFAAIKWLRVPVLDPVVAVQFSRAVLQSPALFLRAWRNDSGLPGALTPHNHLMGVDAVIRHFLWNNLSDTYAAEGTAVLGDCGGPVGDPSYLEQLSKLAEISPALLWKGMEHCRRLPRSALKSLLEAFSCTQLGLPPSAADDQMRNRLQYLETRVLSATLLNEERLKDIIIECFRSKEEGFRQVSARCAADLLKLGQTQSGRRYLSARMCQHWLDQRYA